MESRDLLDAGLPPSVCENMQHLQSTVKQTTLARGVPVVTFSGIVQPGLNPDPLVSEYRISSHQNSGMPTT